MTAMSLAPPVVNEADKCLLRSSSSLAFFPQTAPTNEREMMPLTTTTAIDLVALPSGPRPGCGGGLWWGVSVLSGGPNPWLCRRCEWPNSAAWLDGHAVGAAGSRPECYIGYE
jgi:hypothetical protein